MTGALTVEAMEANGSPVNAAAVLVYGRTEGYFHIYYVLLYR